MPEFYTMKQVAQIVGLTRSAIEWNREQGRIRVTKAPTGRLQISQEDLDAFLAMRDPLSSSKEEHLYEIICISLGQVNVLFSTHSLLELSLMYVRLVEHQHKFVRIRLDGVPLLIHESDRIGFTYHPRMKGKRKYGKVMKRSQGSAEGHLSGHEQVRVQHGEESAVLRRRADGAGENDQLRDRATAGAPEKPVPAVPQSGQGSVQVYPGEAGRAEHPGVSAGPGRKRRVTDEERRLKARERAKRWRWNNPEKVKEADRRHYQANREAKIEQAKKYAREHREEINAYRREWYRRRREAERNDPGTKGD